jgi:hypothetical protein
MADDKKRQAKRVAAENGVYIFQLSNQQRNN